MRIFLIVLCLLIWFFNTELAIMMFPNRMDNCETFKEYYYLRCQLQEVLILAAISIPYFRNSLLSKSILNGVIVIIGASVVDKLFQETFTSSTHDIVVYIASIIIAVTTYRNGKNK